MKVETKGTHVYVNRGIDESAIYDGLVVYRDDGVKSIQIMISGVTVSVDADSVIEVIRKGQKK